MLQRQILAATAFVALAIWPLGSALAETNVDVMRGPETLDGAPAAQGGEQPASGFERQEVAFRTAEPPGTVIIRTDERYLYVVLSANRAMRYGIGVGREGFAWSGVAKISRKEQWPDWRPPASMIDRQPYLPRFVAGGEGNPLGARAFYIGQTEFRIHGTNEPDTIGQAVSSGCFRMVNDDVIDLYGRVPVGAKVIVKQNSNL